MNQIAYFNMFLPFIIGIFLLNHLSGRLIKPSENGEEKEILVVKSKRRLYYPIKSEGLTFNIKGPVRLEFVSRLPVLRDKSKSYPFQYRIVLDETDTINVKHKYKIQDLVEYKSSNPNLENRQAYIKEIKKQADGSYKMMLIVHFDGDNKLKDREYFFNNPEDWATWWIHENDIVKLINRK